MLHFYNTIYKQIRALCLLIMLSFTVALQAQTISPKRGIAGDMLSNADCVTADSLTWYYNWAHTPGPAVKNIHQNYLEYCPMLWNGSWNAAALTTYLDAHPETKYLLAFNEPNFAFQANMTPAQAAALWPQVETIADKYKLKIVSPALGFCPGDCLPGYASMDGTKWLDEFFAKCINCRVDYIAVHIYDTWLYGFKGNLDPYKKYKKPLWVTEFDYGGGTTTAQHASLMVDALNLMEKDPDVFRYSWFLTRSSPNQESTDIFGQASGTLTDLGKIYTHMSSYDKAYFHHVNQIVEAEHYINKSVTYCNWDGTKCTWPSSVLLEPTNDVSGKLDAYHFASPVANANDTLFYQVNIPSSQIYSIDFRVNATAASTIAVRTYPDHVLLGTTSFLNTSGAWLTKTLANVNMTAGKQQIYLTATNGAALKINWFKINCAANCGAGELNEFNVTASGQNGLLNWEMTSEGNTITYVLEKSTNGTTFTSIGSVPSAGVKTYSFTDTDVKGNLNYYRIRFVDTNGGFTYSPIKTLSTVTLADDAIITQLETAQDVSYEIINATGQIMKQGTYHAGPGKTQKSLYLHSLESGIYIVKIVSGKITYSEKICIQ